MKADVCDNFISDVPFLGVLIINFKQDGNQLFFIFSQRLSMLKMSITPLDSLYPSPYASSVDWLLYVIFIKPQNSKEEDEDLILSTLTITKKITLQKPVYNDQLNKF